MVGRAVVTEGGDDFLNANAFVIKSFECDDRIFSKKLKVFLLRERSSEGEKSGKIHLPSYTASCNSRVKA